MAEYVGVIAIIVCVVHFIYQSIILPSVRQSARDELFELRDELRTRLIEVQNESNKNTLLAFKEIDDGINRSLNRLHLLNFSSFVKLTFDAEKSPEKYEKIREKTTAILDNSEDEMPKHVYAEVNKVLHHVFSMNSLMMIVYLLPFVLAISLIHSIWKRLKAGTDLLVATCIGRDLGSQIRA
jgi:hypothetical protein